MAAVHLEHMLWAQTKKKKSIACESSGQFTAMLGHKIIILKMLADEH